MSYAYIYIYMHIYDLQCHLHEATLLNPWVMKFFRCGAGFGHGVSLFGHEPLRDRPWVPRPLKWLQMKPETATSSGFLWAVLESLTQLIIGLAFNFKCWTCHFLKFLWSSELWYKATTLLNTLFSNVWKINLTIFKMIRWSTEWWWCKDHPADVEKPPWM
jgi:hypothetical protein